MNKISVLISFSEESNKKHPFPCPTTYRTALTHYLDITHPPRTNVLYELAQYASDTKDQENMRKMASSSPEGKVSDGFICYGVKIKVQPKLKCSSCHRKHRCSCITPISQMSLTGTAMYMHLDALYVFNACFQPFSAPLHTGTLPELGVGCH